MAEPRKTPTALVLDMKMREAGAGEGIVDAVRRMVAAGKSFRTIASALHELTGERVTHETVRSWAIEWDAKPPERTPA